MPRVGQRKVTGSSRIPIARASAAQFGGQEAQALGQVGQAVKQVGAAGQNIMDRQDSFVAKNAYTQARDEAMTLVSGQLDLKGQNAFSASATTEAGLEEIRKKVSDGMNQRQLNIFNQNWDRSAVNDRQRVAQHQTNQYQVAENEVNVSLIETSVEGFINSGDEFHISEALGAHETIAKSQGWDPAVKQARWNEVEKRAITGRTDLMISLGDYEGARALVEDNTGKDKGQWSFSDDEAALANASIDNAEAKAQANLEAEARARLVEGNMRSMEYSVKKGTTASREQFGAWYSDPEVAAAKWAEATQREADLIQKQTDTEEKAKANDPDIRQQTYGDAAGVARSLATGSGTVAEAQLVLDRLALDDSSMSMYYTGLINDSITSALSTASTTMDNRQLEIKIDTANTFNDVNYKGVFNFEKVEGKVDVDDSGRIKSTNEATQFFLEYMKGWDQLLQQEATDKGSALSINEVNALEQDYFAPIRTWKTRSDFISGSTTTLKELGQSMFETSPDAAQALQFGQELIDTVKLRIP